MRVSTEKNREECGGEKVFSLLSSSIPMHSKKKKNRARKSTAKKKQAASASTAAGEETQSPQTESEFTGNVASATSGQETSGASPCLSSQGQNQAKPPPAPDSASNPIRLDETGTPPPGGSSSSSSCPCCSCCYSQTKQEIIDLTHGAITNTLDAVRFMREEKERKGKLVTNDIDDVTEQFLKMLNGFVFPSIHSSLSTLRDLAEQKEDQPTRQAIGTAIGEVDSLIALHDVAREFLQYKKANRPQGGGTDAVDSGRDPSGNDGTDPDGSGGDDKIVD